MTSGVYDGEGLPTLFAQAIAQEVGLTETKTTQQNGQQILDQITRLKHFQQMSIACSFKESLIAYYGQTLTEEQELALKVIYRSTKPWLLGSTIGSLIDRINNTKITNKDFALSVSTILEQLESVDPKTKDATPTGKMKSLTFALHQAMEQKGDLETKKDE